MPRTIKIMMWSGIGLIAVLAACVVFLIAFDWNHAKPWINSRVSDATGRTFSIDGDLALTWHRPPAATSTWRDWIPVPRLSAHDVRLGNPDWVKSERNMADVGHITFSVNPLPLLANSIVIPTLRLDEPVLDLERTADGKNNWTFKSSTPSAWKLDLQRLELNKGTVRLNDAIKKIDVKADIDTPEDDATYGLSWKLAGKYNGAPVSGNGRAGAVLSLQSELPYPIEAKLNVGKTSIDVTGSLTRPQDLASVDMQLKLSGASMAHLYPLTGIVLPETPAFATQGHLTGVLNELGGDWQYEKFSGKVGSSDLSGTLKYQSKQPRPLLTGSMVSNLLQFKDLAPLIGADSNANKVRRDAAPTQPSNKALPVETFKTERWSSIDADVQFTGRKIISNEELPIDDLVTHVKLDNGVLSLAPLNFGVAGGNLIANIRMDGREKAIRAETKISARHLKLKQLFPAFEPMQASFGEINGDASLSSSGNSIAALLGSANGEIKAVINQGTVSKLLLEQMGLNIGNVILAQLFGDRQVALNCLASDFAVTDGTMQTRTFIVDTDEAVIETSGQINLKQEQLNLTIHPESKGLRLMSLRAPLYVTGNFKAPNVSVDKGVLALKAGGAIALGALAPVAALLPLVNVGPGENSECAQLLQGIKGKPTAPPPGRTNNAK